LNFQEPLFQEQFFLYQRYNNDDEKVNTQCWVNILEGWNGLPAAFQKLRNWFNLRYYVPLRIVLMKLRPLFGFCGKCFYDVFLQYAHL
jgi:hypothetical protein